MAHIGHLVYRPPPPPAEIGSKVDTPVQPGNPECMLCFSNAARIVYVPCGHMVTCLECNERHEQAKYNECPCCKQRLTQRICAYMTFAEAKKVN